MNLQDVFDELAYGELSQIFSGGSPQNEEPDQRRNIIHHVQSGLTALYKRFLLKEGRVHLVPVDGKLIYHLHSDFAQSNDLSTEPVKYIHDTDFPFQDDLFKVERVYDSAGDEQRINVVGHPQSLYTPRPDILGLPATHSFTQLELVYRADHPDVRDDAVLLPLDEVVLELPQTHLQALCYYVAHRKLNPLGPSSEGFHEGNNYYAQFDRECARLENLGYQIDQSHEEGRFVRGGWV